ncbi:hypothetical protein Q8G81_35810, partial [Klebsiella pneumoniae]
TMTISDSSFPGDTSSIIAGQSTSCQASGTEASYAGIFEDHPGLNPNDERVVEYQCKIRDKLEELNGDPETAQIMAEA